MGEIRQPWESTATERNYALKDRVTAQTFDTTASDSTSDCMHRQPRWFWTAVHCARRSSPFRTSHIASSCSGDKLGKHRRSTTLRPLCRTHKCEPDMDVNNPPLSIVCEHVTGTQARPVFGWRHRNEHVRCALSRPCWLKDGAETERHLGSARRVLLFCGVLFSRCLLRSSVLNPRVLMSQPAL